MGRLHLVGPQLRSAAIRHARNSQHETSTRRPYLVLLAKSILHSLLLFPTAAHPAGMALADVGS